MFNYLESKYNDGKKYVLHYVTAREMYNIIKALEEGEADDNPEYYRNHKVLAPKYDITVNISEMSDDLKALIYKTYE